MGGIPIPTLQIEVLSHLGVYRQPESHPPRCPFCLEHNSLCPGPDSERAGMFTCEHPARPAGDARREVGRLTRDILVTRE